MRKTFPVLLIFFMLACSATRVVPSTTVPSSPLDGQPATEGSPAVEVTVPPTGGPAEVVPIPSSPIQIDGVPYTAYQLPGDPFRFVCQDPCTLDVQYIYAEYSGFRLGHAMLVGLTGIDTLPELQPVDMHLDFQDSVCKDFPYGHAYTYTHTHQAYTCTDGPGYYPTTEEKIQMAARADAQYFPLHEYMHTFFFGRLSGQAGAFNDPKAAFMHDYVVQVPSYAIGVLDPAGFCTYRELAPGDYGGFLINELCQLNDFQLTDVASSLVALDGVYASGAGQVAQDGYGHPAATIAQYRDILNNLLGSDTTPAFAAACWPPQLFGNSYTPVSACALSDATSTPIK